MRSFEDKCNDMGASETSGFQKPGYCRTHEVLRLVRYFDIFEHPITAEELYRFAPDDFTLDDIDTCLDQLLQQSVIRKTGAYYLLFDGRHEWVTKRTNGEIRAKRLLPKAMRVGRFLSLFPFVRFVGISGSLSKYYADKETDYDFFIITANNTLWICRTILHIVKKLSFLIGKQHTLCMNYFLDEHHLKLAENNIFVRIELSTLIPVYNQNLYCTFLLRNYSVLPNLRHLNTDLRRVISYDLLKWNRQNLFWKPLNLFFMRWTDLKWRRKWQKRGYPMDDYDLAMKSTPYVSKNHPENWQKKVLGKLQNLNQ